MVITHRGAKKQKQGRDRASPRITNEKHGKKRSNIVLQGRQDTSKRFQVFPLRKEKYR